ncbi:hypothetical protein OIO90_003644 [Microbotryomycetes sp. JL221]|nr:hypothetical protein OIO90_003644 [Microbotryomycetes sp. JL221]
MSTLTRTLVCTGGSSGLGLETIKQVLRQPRWQVFVGARPERRHTLEQTFKPWLNSNSNSNSSHTNSTVTIVDLNLEHVNSIKQFANSVKQNLTSTNSSLDVILLSAAVYCRHKHLINDISARVDDNHTVQFTKEAFVNSLAQHYLIHLLEPELTKQSSKSNFHPRIVFVSSSKQNSVNSFNQISHALLSTTTNDDSTKQPQQQDSMIRYSSSKLIQMASATFWKRKLCPLGVDVVTVSPGFVPTSGLNRESNWFVQLFLKYVLSWAPFVTSIEQGAETIRMAIETGFDKSESSNNKVDVKPLLSQRIIESRQESKVLYIGVCHQNQTHLTNNSSRNQETMKEGWLEYQESKLVEPILQDERQSLLWTPDKDTFEQWINDEGV